MEEINSSELKIIYVGGIYMNHTRYRKHPRLYSRTHDEDEQTMIFDGKTAVGILVGAFIGGLGVGYFIKKMVGD